MRTILFICCLALLPFSCSDGGDTAGDFKLNPFPNTEYSKIVAYKMNGENKDIINKQNSLSNAVVGEGKTLTKDQEKQLLQIYRSKDTYGDDFYRCFEPHLGFVFYNETEQVVAHSTVCFECNWMRTSPDIGAFIFSVKGAKSLVRLEGDIFDF